MFAVVERPWAWPPGHGPSPGLGILHRLHRDLSAKLWLLQDGSGQNQSPGRTLAAGGGGCCAMPGWRPMACTACMACIICIACIWLIGGGCPWWCPLLGWHHLHGMRGAGPDHGHPRHHPMHWHAWTHPIGVEETAGPPRPWACGIGCTAACSQSSSSGSPRTPSRLGACPGACVTRVGVLAPSGVF